MKKEFVFVLGGLAIGFLLVSTLKKKKVVLFMGGLENSKTLKEQVTLFNSENTHQVIVHSYKEFDKLKNNLLKYPNSKIVLFSAGGKYANDIVDLYLVNPKDIFVIEPYTCNRDISRRIPKNNIYGGSSCETGSNVAGIKRSDYGGKNHFDSLIAIGKFLK